MTMHEELELARKALLDVQRDLAAMISVHRSRSRTWLVAAKVLTTLRRIETRCTEALHRIGYPVANDDHVVRPRYLGNKDD